LIEQINIFGEVDYFNLDGTKNEEIMSKRMLSVKDYASEVGKTVQAVYKMIREDRIEYKKIGSMYLVLV